jgi:hypothetical protein
VCSDNPGEQLTYPMYGTVGSYIENLGSDKAGRFYSDSGQEIPW